MFLHQIFYQGLKARIASWPTLVLGKKQLLLIFMTVFHNAKKKKPFVIVTVSWYLSLYSRPVRHPAAHVEYLPGVCKEPPVQPADPSSLQAESRLWQAVEAVRGQAWLWGEDSGDLPHLPHVPGELICLTDIYTRNKGRPISLLQSCSLEPYFVVNSELS